ncbi:hypothetical protein [Arthrobacter sp. ISL-28]|uniref:hypothetical protein n=1 Tax=Arthrobacter sp. ISL-28 TaxID=2819108 RepID=UPI001BECFC5C|nr:hypothetical protein [Arthrobacter sp. ISL-28]MBT2520007.1 hypothetical protein [Arthrobacter sp. ISL-28]
MLDEHARVPEATPSIQIDEGRRGHAAATPNLSTALGTGRSELDVDGTDGPAAAADHLDITKHEPRVIGRIEDLQGQPAS